MLIRNIIFITLCFLTITLPAYAYLDPGAASIVLQALIGGVAATVGFFSLYYHKIKKFFSILRNNKK